MSAQRTTSEGASWVGRIFCAGGADVAEAGTGVAEAGTGVGVDEVVPLRQRGSVQWSG